MPEINSTDKYGCYNRPPLLDKVSMQNGTECHGWKHHNGAVDANVHLRVQKFKVEPFRMSRDCQYDKSGSDPRCEGCKHHNPENASKYSDKNDGGVIAWLIPGWTKELWEEFKEWRANK